MKAFKLREEKTFIKVLKEPPVEKKKVNWSRRVYIGIFTIAGLYIVYKVFCAYFIIVADGQLELPKQTISFSDDIEVIKFYAEEGQLVEKGDTLFQYKVSADASQLSSITALASNKGWITKDQITAKKNHDLAKIKRQRAAKEVKALESSLESSESLLMLGVNEEHERFQSISGQLVRAASELMELDKEIELYQYQLNALKAHQKELRETENEKLALLTNVKTFVASRKGTISDILYETNEICYKKEELMTIHKTEGASITTYFDPSEVTHVKEGEVVDIEFPDGTKSKGVIKKLLVSTYALPSEFQKKYEPTERNIVAEVVPLLKSDESTWNNFYKMDVRINKWRYNFF